MQIVGFNKKPNQTDVFNLRYLLIHIIKMIKLLKYVITYLILNISNSNHNYLKPLIIYNELKHDF